MSPNDSRSGGTPRLLPIVMFCLCGTIIFKSAGLIEAAFAKTEATSQVSKKIDARHSDAEPTGSNAPPNSNTMPYAPVANWTDRPPPPPLCKPDPLDQAGERKILLQLKQRAKQLDARAAALDQQEAELTVAKAAIAKQVAALKPLAKRLEAMNAEHHAANEKKWAALVSTYETMDPRSAARIFDGLDPEVVLNVLQRMNSRKSAPILAAMTPKKAQMVTEKLAGISQPSIEAQPAASLLPDGAP